MKHIYAVIFHNTTLDELRQFLIQGGIFIMRWGNCASLLVMSSDYEFLLSFSREWVVYGFMGQKRRAWLARRLSPSEDFIQLILQSRHHKFPQELFWYDLFLYRRLNYTPL